MCTMSCTVHCSRVHYSMFTVLVFFFIFYLHSLSAFYALWSRFLLNLCARLTLNIFIKFILLFIRSTLEKKNRNFSLCVTWPQYLLRKHLNENKCSQNCAFGFGFSQPSQHIKITRTLFLINGKTLHSVTNCQL